MKRRVLLIGAVLLFTFAAAAGQNSRATTRKPSKTAPPKGPNARNPANKGNKAANATPMPRSRATKKGTPPPTPRPTTRANRGKVTTKKPATAQPKAAKPRVTTKKPATAQTAKARKVPRTAKPRVTTKKPATAQTAKADPDLKGCKVVIVYGGTLHPSLNGHYLAQPKDYNGQPMFGQVSSERTRFMWWKNHGSYTRWYIGAHLGSSSVEGYRDGKGKGDARLLTSEEKWWAVVDGQWKQDGNLKIKCGDDGKNEPAVTPPPAAPAIRIEGATRADVNGIFEGEQRVHDSKPVYKHKTSNFFMWYKRYEHFSRWYVGADVGNPNNVVLFVDSNAAQVDLVEKKASWTELKSGQWVPKKTITANLVANYVPSEKKGPRSWETENVPIRGGDSTMCHALIVGSDDSELNKEYKTTPLDYEGRPVYKSKDNEYIFFMSHSDDNTGKDGRWYISYPGIHPDRIAQPGKEGERIDHVPVDVQAYVKSNAMTIDKVTESDAQWFVLQAQTKEWFRQQNMSVFCADCTVALSGLKHIAANGIYKIQPFTHKGKPVYQSKKDYTLYSMSRFKNRPRWQLISPREKIENIHARAVAYVYSNASTPGVIDKYVVWEEADLKNQYQMKQNRSIKVKGTCGGVQVEHDWKNNYGDTGEKTITTGGQKAAPGLEKGKDFNQPPKKSRCPQDLEVIAERRKKYAIVHWTDPARQAGIAVDYHAPGMSPGSKFDIGETAVMFNIKENGRHSEKCDFKIKVLDKEAPQFDCPADINSEVKGESNTVAVHWKEPTAWDNSGGQVEVKQIKGKAPGSQFATSIKSNIIQYEGADPTGNKGYCSFRVWVRDARPPKMQHCPKDMTIDVFEANDWSASPTWTLPSAADANKRPIKLRQVAGVAPGTAMQIPPNQETNLIVNIYKGSDRNGNAVECEFKLTLRKNRKTKTGSSNPTLDEKKPDSQPKPKAKKQPGTWKPKKPRRRRAKSNLGEAERESYDGDSDSQESKDEFRTKGKKHRQSNTPHKSNIKHSPMSSDMKQAHAQMAWMTKLVAEAGANQSWSSWFMGLANPLRWSMWTLIGMSAFIITAAVVMYYVRKPYNEQKGYSYGYSKPGMGTRIVNRAKTYAGAAKSQKDRV